MFQITHRLPWQVPPLSPIPHDGHRNTVIVGIMFWMTAAGSLHCGPPVNLSFSGDFSPAQISSSIVPEKNQAADYFV